jgi:hypothetical protein
LRGKKIDHEKGATMPAGYLTDATGTAAPCINPANGTISAGPYLNNITIARNKGDIFSITGKGLSPKNGWLFIPTATKPAVISDAQVTLNYSL